MSHLAKQLEIDAVRIVPASFDPFQGRIRGEGLFGTDYAVAVVPQSFRQLTRSRECASQPGEWVALERPTLVSVVSQSR